MSSVTILLRFVPSDVLGADSSSSKPGKMAGEGWAELGPDSLAWAPRGPIRIDGFREVRSVMSSDRYQVLLIVPISFDGV